MELAGRVREQWGDHFKHLVYHGAQGAELDADLLVPFGPTRGTIVLLHGLGDRKEGMLEFAETFANAGYLTIAPDLRGHGDSSARYTTFGWLERWDCVALLNAVAKMDLSDAGLGRAQVSEVGVIGGSLGASVALEWAGVDPRVRTIIALAPYATLRDEADYLYSQATPPPSPQRIREIECAIHQEGHFRIDDVRPIDTLRRRALPVYLIRGDEDKVIPPVESDRLFAVAIGPVVLQRVPGAGHEDLIGALMKTPFLKHVVQWMDAYLAAKPSHRGAEPSHRGAPPAWVSSLAHRNFAGAGPSSQKTTEAAASRPTAAHGGSR